MSSTRFFFLVAAIFVLLAVFHQWLVTRIGVERVLGLLFVVVLISGRIGLYVYRKSRGRKDRLDTQRWWDVF
ncbi:hypothetical protein RA263_19935 [Pseudomonas syringae pv. tagetis]|uniref:Uncharacterized protein n=2 Tax=Pseudomonas syringae group genomosp. 7 TaxID=251699 RepID=A0A0Q0BC36_9PSED|nr:hypothetical protein [Pseudomonas syringae group genomosp. 7]KPY86268.1 Uncharacterized protein ALO44_01784 [Pseudomonas syringae pv. tagetis]RMV49018.1 hypothetical protein ALP10_02444 [Pseudomonas syringae pv. helianthi]RMW08494.1 hypothetical protein ALO98_200209 [Pseudomonas syringae pv. tagetis]RMW14445.1 hypothetical protein ALO97_01604 [Pseudomonas syringae pv. tagetis]UNB69354.1 hypothetical protein MME58_03590 [Pseudomonas syringae pv. tagetis]